jgi:hypothetical protein
LWGLSPFAGVVAHCVFEAPNIVDWSPFALGNYGVNHKGDVVQHWKVVVGGGVVLGYDIILPHNMADSGQLLIGDFNCRRIAMPKVQIIV